MPYVDFIPEGAVNQTPKNRIFEDFVPEPKPQLHKEEEVESTDSQDKVDEVAEVPTEPKKSCKKKK